jgi:hypothetical protein
MSAPYQPGVRLCRDGPGLDIKCLSDLEGRN